MKRSSHPATAGFTLIELLAVMTIIGILAVALVTGVRKYIAMAKISACQANMREVQQMLAFMETNKKLPVEGGVALLYELWMKSGVEQTMKNADRFRCPEVEKLRLGAWVDPETSSPIVDPTRIWGDRSKGPADEENRRILENIRTNPTDYSPYRVINQKHLKWGFRKLLSGKTPIIADGNPAIDEDTGDETFEADCNHADGVTNVGYGDGTVEKYDPSMIEELAGLEGRERYQIVGPNAPHAQKDTPYALFKYLVFRADEND